MKGMPGEFDD